MRIRIDRRYRRQGYTVSRVFIDGDRFGDGRKWCNILEDEDRGLNADMSVNEIMKYKIHGQTAIPRGVYDVSVTYSNKFCRRLPLLKNVKGFSGVRIHPGNHAGDTEGCLLPGVNDAVGRVSNSRYWFQLLYCRIEASLNRGEHVWLEIG